MCGIAGIYYLDGCQVDLPQLVRMTRLLSRRGPDGEGYLVASAGSLGFGHRRLAILDVSNEARQPMGRDGTWVVFNGEIYNFLEIRKDLAARGYLFSSDSDTEVLLRAYEEWGLDTFAKFNGCWAAAIWDETRRELLLVRDRFGVKPLWILSTANLIAFASERKAFIPLNDLDTRPTQTENGLEWHHAKALLPGHALRVTRFNSEHIRWWRTKEHFPELKFRAYDDAVEHYRELLLDACRIRLRSDVPVASSVSGGVDSSAVLCAVGHLGRHDTVERRPADWRRAYYMDWPSTPQDELRWARSASDAAEAQLHRVDSFAEQLTVADVIDLLGTIESPQPIFIAPWLLYRRMRRDGVVVTLDGQGGDEINGGYVYHVMARAAECEGFIRRPFEALRLACLLYRVHAREDAVWPHLSRVKAAMVVSSIGRHMLRVWRTGRRLLDVANFAQRPPPEWLERDVENMGSLTRLQYIDIHTRLSQGILHHFDLVSMAHGIETRMPFLDWRLVTFALSLSSEFRVGRGRTKRIERDAAAAFTPSDVCYRRLKVGFLTPLADLLKRNSELAEWSRDYADPSHIDDPQQQLRSAAQRWVREQWLNWVRSRVAAGDVSPAFVTKVDRQS